MVLIALRADARSLRHLANRMLERSVDRDAFDDLVTGDLDHRPG